MSDSTLLAPAGWPQPLPAGVHVMRADDANTLPPIRAALSARLDARERELQAEVRAVNEESAQTPTREPHLQVGDLGKRVRSAPEMVRYAEKERDIQELRQIADARERLHDGNYGLCIDCGTAIWFARLEALPISERRVPCQEA